MQGILIEERLPWNVCDYGMVVAFNDCSKNHHIIIRSIFYAYF